MSERENERLHNQYFPQHSTSTGSAQTTPNNLHHHQARSCSSNRSKCCCTPNSCCQNICPPQTDLTLGTLSEQVTELFHEMKNLKESFEAIRASTSISNKPATPSNSTSGSSAPESSNVDVSKEATENIQKNRNVSPADI